MAGTECDVEKDGHQRAGSTDNHSYHQVHDTCTLNTNININMIILIITINILINIIFILIMIIMHVMHLARGTCATSVNYPSANQSSPL